MDVSPVYRGKGTGTDKGKGKGKGMGKWKERDNKAVANPVSELVCCYCLPKGYSKQDGQFKVADKTKKGLPLNAIEQAAGQGSAARSTEVTTPTRFSMIEVDDWILMVSADDHEMQVQSIERVMDEQCPLGFSPDVPIASRSRSATW